MRIFLSYASQDREAASAIARCLAEQGHDVFFDREDLPPGEEFHSRIRGAIEKSHLVVFLVSPDAVDAGSYTITEVEIAEKAWKRAGGRLLPVVLRPTPLESLPPFVRSVTLLETTGNVPAAVAAAVHRAGAARARRRRGKIGLALAAASLVGLVTWRLAAREPAAVAVAVVAAEREPSAADGAPAVLVPGGTFTMGDDEESPRREVFVDSFYIDRFEVTTARYARFLAATGSLRAPDEWETLTLPAGGDLPVVGVDWNDADAYCRWAGRRLPTEAEWEKAARGTDGRRYPWGDMQPTPRHANYGNASPLTYDGGLAAVGTHGLGDGPYGASDMAGNAGEWVADWYAESFASGDVRNPAGPDAGEGKVIRGGGRYDPGDRVSAVKRFHASPDGRLDDVGFRCARDAD
ncbi:MAG: SUMF1/EgtB/PvdO family nonheme iron enzyme [Longimicrobiaceae bacterium]